MKIPSKKDVAAVCGDTAPIKKVKAAVYGDRSKHRREFTLMMAQLILFGYARGLDITIDRIEADGLGLVFSIYIKGEYCPTIEEGGFFERIRNKWKELGGIATDINCLEYEGAR